MYKYKLVFEEKEGEFQIYFLDEYEDDGDFLRFIDNKTGRKIIIAKKFLVKIVELPNGNSNRGGGNHGGKKE